MEVMRSTDGDRADFPRLLNRYIIRSDATGGRFALIEHEILPRALAAPVHTHQHEDEYSFVLEGRVGVRIGDEEGIAEPGDRTVVLPHEQLRRAQRRLGDLVAGLQRHRPARGLVGGQDGWRR